MKKPRLVLLISMTCVLISACTNQASEPVREPITDPVVHSRTALPTSVPVATPPSDFKHYHLPQSDIGIYLPQDWMITSEIPGEFAILQSYPKKYAGGGAWQPGETKCDLAVEPLKISFDEMIQEIRSSPSSEIISEKEVKLNNADKAVRFEMNNLGLSRLMAAEFKGQLVTLVCFGDLAPFDEIAFQLYSE